MSAREVGMGPMPGSDLAAAVQQLQAAAHQQPEDGQAWGRLGLALCRAGRYGEGVRALEEATRLLPTIASLHYALALGYEQLGRREQALQSFQRVLSLQPEHLQAAQALHRLGGAVAPTTPAPVPPHAPPMPDFSGPPSLSHPPPAYAQGWPVSPPGEVAAAVSPPLNAPPAYAYRPPLAVTPEPEDGAASSLTFKRQLAAMLAAVVVLGGLIIVAGRQGHLGIGVARFLWAGRPLQTTAPGPRFKNSRLRVTVASPVGFSRWRDSSPELPLAFRDLLGPLAAFAGGMQPIYYRSKCSLGACLVREIPLPREDPSQWKLENLGDVSAFNARMIQNNEDAEARLLEQRPIRHQGRAGLEKTLEITSRGKTGYIRDRLFLTRSRAIVFSMLVVKKEHLNTPAVKAYFDSIELNRR